MTLLDLDGDCINFILGLLSNVQKAVLRSVCKKLNKMISFKKTSTEEWVVYGSLSIIKMLTLNYELTKFSAMYGKTEFLKYIKEKSPRYFNENICAAASYNGCLDTLKYLRENDCPCDKYTILLAIVNFKRNIINYIRENKIYCDECICITASFYYDDNNTLRDFQENICPCDIHYVSINEYGVNISLQSLDFAHEKQEEFTRNFMNKEEIHDGKIHEVWN